MFTQTTHCIGRTQSPNTESAEGTFFRIFVSQVLEPISAWTMRKYR